jgi:iron complex outermembrane receptor protein
VLAQDAPAVQPTDATADTATAPDSSSGDTPSSTVPADASAIETSQVETVTVTARRRNEEAQDVPIPITTLSSDKLEKAGIVRLEDLEQKLPSANFLFTNPRQTSLSVRGLGNNPANDALESSVGVYLDNVYLGRPGMANTDLIDIDQISLIQGPQGTLFGKNTTAGVLNITTKLPSFAPEATAEASYGSYDYYQARAAISGPLVDDQVAGRLSVAQSHQGGFLTSVYNGQKYNGYNRQAIRGQLLYKPAENFTLRVIGDYNHENSPCCYSVYYSLGPLVPVPGSPPGTPPSVYLLQYKAAQAGAIAPYVDPDLRTVFGGDNAQAMHVNQGGASAEANWTLKNGYKLTSITAYRSWGFDPVNEDGLSIDSTTNAGQGVDDKQFSQELRLASPTGKHFDYVVGAYYFFQNQDNRLYTQYGPAAGVYLGAPALNNLLTLTDQTLATDSSSIFGQATFHATDQLNITGGVRETFESKTTVIVREAPQRNGAVVSPAPASAAPYQSGPLGLRDYDLSALLSLDYKISDDFMVYGSASRGAKAGGINPSVPPTQSTSPLVYASADQTLYIKPEKANDLELGFKSTLWERRLLLNTDVFKTLVKDYQTTGITEVSPGVFTQTLQNVGYVRTQGVETQVQLIPLTGLSLALAGSYNDAIYKSFSNAPCSVEVKVANPAQTACDLTDSQVVGAPRWIVNPSVSYEHVVFEDIRGYGTANYAWRSSFFGSPDDSRYARIPAYGIANLRIGASAGFGMHGWYIWDVSVWANNVFDKHYSPGGLGISQYNSYSEFAGLPRLIGATVRLDF